MNIETIAVVVSSLAVAGTVINMFLSQKKHEQSQEKHNESMRQLQEHHNANYDLAIVSVLKGK